ncbi:MAG: hypothetical protein RBU29_08755 [bacterium]|jgi:hypothetical protein|nr:hypothetical protein [bacterium]
MRGDVIRIVMHIGLIVVLALGWGVIGNAEDAAFQQVIEADWAQQEERLGRQPSDPTAIADALARTTALFQALSAAPQPLDLSNANQTLTQYQEQALEIETRSGSERLALYHAIRWLNRETALRNPLLPSTPLVFMKRHRFICQMLHEYLGYFYDYGDIAGGGVYRLEKPGYSFEHTDLIQDRLPKGNFTTLALAYDAQTVYFAFAERAPQKPEYDSPERRGFHLYQVKPDGSGLVQLTDEHFDDFDPCPLPDGGLAFMSTRRGGFGRCHNPWEPLATYTLHRMNADGGAIQTLSFHETNEWHPQVLNDGRIVYTRWDYVDRSAAHFHGLWISNPDGTNPIHLFGSYTQRINACYQPHPIPHSRKVMFVAGAHHADVGGSLVMVDPERVALDPQTGEDDLGSIERVTPSVCFPETEEGWPDSYFHSPWPLSEDFYLVSFSFDPLPGMGPNVASDTETGLYLLDRFGTMELLFREPGISAMYPIPLAPRPVPPAIPSQRDPQLGEEGEFMLSNIYNTLYGTDTTNPVQSLRIFQILPKSETHVANQPRIGYANAESARMLLGEVPVEPDGSAYFRAPANVPLAFQSVDASGRAIHGMRSITYLQPGERRGCVGCHESRGTVQNTQRLQAFQRPPSVIAAGLDGSKPWSFPRLVQPVLEAHCIQCHNGDAHPLNLRSQPTEDGFTLAYGQLRPYVRWYEWGDATIRPITTLPGQMPASVSPLTRILEEHRWQNRIELSEAEWKAIFLWLDGNASFYGSYSPSERLAQRQGEAIPPPALQ